MLIIVYFIVLTIYGFAEIALQKWFSKQKSQKPDSGLALIIIPLYAALYLAPVEYFFLRPSVYTSTIIVGYFLLLMGVIMRLLGLMALKQNFSMAIECKDETLLVTTGIYKHLRHPLYLATLLIASSGCFIFSAIFCWLFFVITIYGILKRINKEEIFLNKQFSQYSSYSKRSKKLIPFIY